MIHRIEYIKTPRGTVKHTIAANGKTVSQDWVKGGHMPPPKPRCPRCHQLMGCGCGKSTKRVLRSRLHGSELWLAEAEARRIPSDCPECLAWKAEDWRVLLALAQAENNDQPCGC